MALWRTAERAAGWLLDAGFNQLTRPRKSLDDRVRELDGTLEASAEEGHPEPPREPAPGREVITRRGVDAERMPWQDALIRGELWLLEGHLKNGCIGCGDNVECCFKHTLNAMDAARETRSTATDPVYADQLSHDNRLPEPASIL